MDVQLKNSPLQVPNITTFRDVQTLMETTRTFCHTDSYIKNSLWIKESLGTPMKR